MRRLHSYLFLLTSTSLYACEIESLGLLCFFSCFRSLFFKCHLLPRDIFLFLLLLFVTATAVRLDSTKGSYAKEWAKWEKQLREVLFGNAEYLNSVQVKYVSFCFVL